MAECGALARFNWVLRGGSFPVAPQEDLGRFFPLRSHCKIKQAHFLTLWVKEGGGYIGPILTQIATKFHFCSTFLTIQRIRFEKKLRVEQLKLQKIV